MNLTQQRFYGFQNTPFLWNGFLSELEQFESSTELLSIREKVPNLTHDKSAIRLGNYVERLVSYALHQNCDIQILKENVQIISNKVTLGEIDCLLLHSNQPVHL